MTDDNMDAMVDSGFKKWAGRGLTTVAIVSALAIGSALGSISHTVGNWVNPDYAAGGKRFSAHSLSLTKGEIYEMQGGNPGDKLDCYFDGRQLVEVKGIQKDGELMLGNPCLVPEGYGPLPKEVAPEAVTAPGYKAAKPAGE